MLRIDPDIDHRHEADSRREGHQSGYFSRDSGLGLPSRDHAARTQPTVATATPNCLATNALDALALSTLPALKLKPNRPTYLRRRQSRTILRLCGFMDLLA